MDYYFTDKENAPVWFKKYRRQLFGIYMILTSLLFLSYYRNLDIIQRRSDPNRVKNLKSVIELEDVDFIKMVEELKLDFDEVDLRDVQTNVSNTLTKVAGEMKDNRY